MGDNLKKRHKKCLKIEEFVGKKFGRLTIISDNCMYDSQGNRISGASKFNCLCDCGTEGIYRSNFLLRGITTSCGCFKSEKTSFRSSTHGQTNSYFYEILRGIRRRCYDEKIKSYSDYGKRGIIVCERWLEPNGQGLLNFIMDMGERPSPQYSIERIDVNGNYEPENCKWATPKEQGNNKRNNNTITYKGETKTLTEWSEFFNIKRTTLSYRLKKGMDFEEAISLPVLNFKNGDKK